MAQEASLSERFRDMMTDRVIPEIGAELKRLGVQGQMELANALFNGNSFVPYGPGQYTPSQEQGHEPEPAMDTPEQQQHRGRSM
jgi:hypothetical protein